jgi:putative oxidoreductase
MKTMVSWRRVANMTFWTLQGFLAVAFLYFGASKFGSGAAFWIELFAKIGIGQWFRYFTGGLEIICAILLLIPQTSAIAAALLACTMVGATAAHLFVIGDSQSSFITFSLFLILCAIVWKRFTDMPLRQS